LKSPLVRVSQTPSGAGNLVQSNVKRTDPGSGSQFADQRINWYIRDSGSGKTSFDQISFVSGIAVAGDRHVPIDSWEGRPSLYTLRKYGAGRRDMAQHGRDCVLV